jgi:hypothetical protein
VARTWISYRFVPRHPWCTHRTFLVVKTLFQFPCDCEQFHSGRSFDFLVINVWNHRENYETPCIHICVNNIFGSRNAISEKSRLTHTLL